MARSILVLVAALALLAAACSSNARKPPCDCKKAADADDLIDVASLAPGIRLDIRYATRSNFTGEAVYPAARCLLRRPVAEALARAQAVLETRGLGLRAWDCYRPFSVQERLWELVPDERYVARPVRGREGKPLDGSKHSRGAAVDVTLVDASGAELDMPTAYDDFTERAHRDSHAWSAAERENAATLEQAMIAEGFTPFPTEWWHFDDPGWERFSLEDRPLSGP